jgi:hypothetical protein
MYVKIGPYINWVGPYQLADMIFFWVKKYPEEELVNRWDYKLHDKFGTWLASTWVADFCQWIQDFRKRKIEVRIDSYDVWSMDSTLTPIILPMLKKLKEVKHRSGFIDLEDVPVSMRYTDTEEWDPQQTFEFYREPNLQNVKCDIHTRYEWVLNEMIWAFEQLNDDDWEDQYWTTHTDESKTSKPLCWKIKGEFDFEGMQKHRDRIQNGVRLFGKYFQTLWD